MRVLVATDGKPGSLGALRLAATLERDVGAAVSVVRAIQPVPIYGPTSSPLHLMPVAPAIEEACRAAELETARLLASVGSAAPGWPSRLEIGSAPGTIVRVASEEDASLIVLGLGRHDRLDRWFGTETALRVVQMSHIPVLAVPGDAVGRRPRSAVVAVDFSDYSRRALEEAVRLCGPGVTLHVVYVLAVPEDLIDFGELRAIADYHERVKEELRAWTRSMKLEGEAEIVFHSLEGKIAEEVLRFADDLDADLIAAGSHGMGFLTRTIVGSVSTRLLRGALRPVLIVPPVERLPELEVG